MDGGKLFISVDKADYKNLVGIDESNKNFHKIAFISDGSGIITHGQLYVNSPYWIEVVNEIPSVQQENTIYLLTEGNQ